MSASDWFKNNSIAFVVGGTLSATVTWGVLTNIQKRESEAFIQEKAALLTQIMMYQKQVDDLKKSTQLETNTKIFEQQQKYVYVQRLGSEIQAKENDYRICTNHYNAEYIECQKIAGEVQNLQENRTKVMLAK